MTSMRHGACARFVLVLPVLVALAGPLRAEGAVAIGSTGDVPRDGFAWGVSYDVASAAAADEEAVANCRKYQGAAKAVARCEVVIRFKGECYAIAQDPKAGTPGVGWAVAVDKATAESRAMSACHVTAGANRRKFCKIDSSGCDGG